LNKILVGIQIFSKGENIVGHNEEDDNVALGTATVLVNVGAVPLALTGTIERITELELCDRKHDENIVFIPKPIHVDAEVEEEEEFLVIDVTTAILPPGFPLTIAQLTAGVVAVNLDYVILIVPV
jgi:hypothetical protein